MQKPVDMLEAKTSHSKVVKSIERGRERENVVDRNDPQAAGLLAIDTSPAETRIGIARGMFVVPEGIDKHDAEVVALFAGEASF